MRILNEETKPERPPVVVEFTAEEMDHLYVIACHTTTIPLALQKANYAGYNSTYSKDATHTFLWNLQQLKP